MGAYPVHLQGYGFLRARRCTIPATPGSVAPAQRKSRDKTVLSVKCLFDCFALVPR
jgi:hypothetical protein